MRRCRFAGLARWTKGCLESLGGDNHAASPCRPETLPQYIYRSHVVAFRREYQAALWRAAGPANTPPPRQDQPARTTGPDSPTPCSSTAWSSGHRQRNVRDRHLVAKDANNNIAHLNMNDALGPVAIKPATRGARPPPTRRASAHSRAGRRRHHRPKLRAWPDTRGPVGVPPSATFIDDSHVTMVVLNGTGINRVRVLSGVFATDNVSSNPIPT